MRRVTQLKWRQHMLLATRPLLKDRNLSINGKEALKDVPENIVVMPLTDTSAFVGATSPHASSRHVFKLGVIKDVRLLCLFRFKLWWMIPRTGSSASDIPLETQMLLLEARQGPTSSQSTYIIFLPVLDGNFRSSLQGNSSDELEFCVESGDPAVVTSESPKAVFVNYGDHPFDLVKDSMMILEKQFGTFALRETKQAMQTPGMLDWFGWCTWDAFYSDVNPQGIKDGLMSLSQGGTPARFLLIDDGWQDTINEFLEQGEPFVDGLHRLANIKENKKFRRIANEVNSKTPSDLKEFISDTRTFDLKYVYVWHALLGCWGGLVPNAVATKNYDPKLRYPILSPVYLANMRDISMDSMGKYGICLVDPDKISQFYDDLHGYLASQDVDGVKVDAQNILETISAGLGGRVSLTRRFQQALEGSIAANFSDNSIICCMAQSTDSIYHLKQSAVSRASDDFYPKEPTTWARHVAAVAFNSILHGELVVPDWDIDKPGRHDFKILQRLVLPDGSVLRAKYPGRPSRDCLFTDPVTDGKSSELSGQVSPACVEYLEEVIGLLWTGECAVFSFKTGGALECVEDSTATDSSGCSKYIMHVKGRGAGCFGAYSNCKPISCSINLKDEDFNFNDQLNLLTITIPPRHNSSWDIAICY
ncbi:hypothetical protein GOBAR_DD28304 [Gossypium barbadense]|nr:hypothetical protein GOBAR_DD28304 [Gossypium barbadense]